MALQIDLTLKSGRYPRSYVRVLRFATGKAEGCRATVAIYATKADRDADRAPVETYEINTMFSDTPFAALYGAIRTVHQSAIDV